MSEVKPLEIEVLSSSGLDRLNLLLKEHSASVRIDEEIITFTFQPNFNDVLTQSFLFTEEIRLILSKRGYVFGEGDGI